MSKRHEGRGPSQRQLRVGEELRHVLANLIERGELSDPRLAGVSLTVTAVDVSPDLRNADVYFVPFGLEFDPAHHDTKEILEALAHAAPFLRRQVARQVRLKFLPALHFRLDSSFDQADRINTLLHDPAVARDLAAPDDDRDDDRGDDPDDED